MRRVDRTRVPVPSSLEGEESLGAKELVRATKHFKEKEPGPFGFSAYKQPDVVDALHKMFFGKCAYCESRFQSVSPTDVEHFRPKGKVSECSDHPGYWWLAAKWENLLASCIDCNRRRYHDATELADDPLDEKKRGKYMLGKGDSFPILGKQYAVKETDDHDAEDAALLDPTQRDPKVHLAWIEANSLSLVGPRMHAGTPDPYGRHTYRVFGLNRQGLVEERTSLLLTIRSQLVFIVSMIDRALVMPDPYGSEQLDEAFQQFLSLYEHAEPDRPYSAMVEELLEKESETLVTKYEQLKAEKQAVW